MASVSEITFGARLHRAEQMVNHLLSFAGYQPARPDCSAPEYQLLINGIKANNTVLVQQRMAFTLAVDVREKLFKKEPGSMIKLMSPIGSYVKAVFGKTAPQTEVVMDLINKIRGEKTTHLQLDAAGEFVSQSHRSYGSMTQTFTDLIGVLQSFGQTYHPANLEITTIKLLVLLAGIQSANDLVTTTYGTLKPRIDARTDQFDELRIRSLLIKDAVKSQYGNASAEYALIKGLKF